MKAHKKTPTPELPGKTETFGGPYHRFESDFRPKTDAANGPKHNRKHGKKNEKRKRK